ncbi:MAG: DUF481 domain-containing protein [Candidatus Aminicenantes bacterium]|nr:DUF481 domain-containing protein [Candidatus Aminicenantes bacterium]
MLGKSVFPLIFAWTLVLLPVFGQDADTAGEPPRWGGDVSLGLSLARGNTRSSSLSFTFSAAGPVNRTKTITLSNKGIYLFGEIDGETNSENIFLAGRLDWKLSERFFTFFEVQAARDRFKNYASRILPAVGAGYKVFDGEKVAFGIDVGLTRILTRYYDSKLIGAETALKFGERLVWKVGEASEFNQVVEIVPEFGFPGRYSLRLEANLVAPLDGLWAVKLTVIDAYNSRPVGPGIRKNDMAFIASMSRSF